MHTSSPTSGRFPRLAGLVDPAISLVSAGVLELLDISVDKSRCNCPAIISRRPDSGLYGRSFAVIRLRSTARRCAGPGPESLRGTDKCYVSTPMRPLRFLLMPICVLMMFIAQPARPAYFNIIFINNL